MGDVRTGASSTTPDTDLARRAIGGDGEAFGLLFDRWFDRAFDVAWHIVHSREAAADVTQDAFAAAWRQIAGLRQPESFGGWLLRITRNRALNSLQREQRSRPVGSEEALVSMDPRPATAGSTPEVALEEQEYGDLVWAASAALGEEDASLLNLHLRHGLGPPEIAEELDVKPNAAHQRLFRLKKRLADAIGAWVLWHQGTPTCSRLQEALDQVASGAFDGTTARAITRHARACEDCESRRELRLRPDALFAATPLVVAEPVLRAKVVAALEGLDVPVSGAGAQPQGGPGGPDGPPEAGGPEAGGPGDAGDTDAGTAGNDQVSAGERTGTEQSHPPDPGDGSGPAPTPDGAGSPPVPGWRRAAIRSGVVAAAVVVLGVAALAVLAGPAGEGDGDADVLASEDTVPPPASAGPTTTGDPSTSTGESTGTADGATSVAPTTGAGSEGPSAEADGEPPGEVADPAPDPAGGGTTGTPATPSTTAPDRVTEPPVPAPEIVRFGVAAGEACGSTQQVQATFTWATVGASSGTLASGSHVERTAVPDGSVTRCAAPGTRWTLTVAGDGGTAEKTVVVPAGSRSGPGDISG